MSYYIFSGETHEQICISVRKMYFLFKKCISLKKNCISFHLGRAPPSPVVFELPHGHRPEDFTGREVKNSPFIIIQREVKNSSFIIIQMSEGADKESTTQI